MRVSLAWLRELVVDLDASATTVADRLTRGGLEVEAVERFGAPTEGVFVARVATIAQHPTKSGLRLVTVDIGDKQQTVVCGASNVPDAGGLVVLATLGTTLPAVGMTLEPRKIAGVVSEGMLCSELELGLSEASEGIIVLPPDSAQPGRLFTEAFPAAADTIFEIGVTPNRPDALGHVGVARDLAAVFGLSVRVPSADAPARSTDEPIDRLVTIDNRDPERCGHYAAAAVVDVTIGPSPDWLRWRLHSLGIRPISNVVDVTNLLLLERGQPMHAFDLDLVQDDQIVIRRASDQEPFRTLDGVDHKLVADDLVICDGRGPVALAGVMGGENTEIRSSTKRVLLECAYFAARGVRRTGRRHGISTESSFRFERGTDHGGVSAVLIRARSLLTQLAGGAAVSGEIHARGELPELPEITLRSARLNALLGYDVPFADALRILEALGFEVLERSDTDARVRGASWRPDVSIEADLIEEVARIRGLDEIPTELPSIPPQPPRACGKLERGVQSAAEALGLSEAVTYSFVSRRELEAVRAPAPVIELLNPLTEERSVMRTSLLPGLLEALKRGRRRGERALQLFTVGALFLPITTSQTDAASSVRPRVEADTQALPEERPSFACVLAGPRPSYLTKPEDVDVYDAKGVAIEIIWRTTRREATVESFELGTAPAHLHPRGAGKILIDGTPVGTLGPLHPDVIDALDLDGPAMVVELDLSATEALGRLTPKYTAIPKLPAVTRDLSIVVKSDVLIGEAQGTILQAAGELCESVELFDTFSGDNIPDGHRSLAFRVVYRDPKARTSPDEARTLTDKEVDKQHQRVFASVSKTYGAQLRG